MENDILLAGRRPDDSDGLKVRCYPEDGHVRVSFLARNGHEIHSFELSGIEDLRELNHVVQRAVARHEELFPEKEAYLQNVRRILAPQTDSHMAAIINAQGGHT